jgi:hypothetical protein
VWPLEAAAPGGAAGSTCWEVASVGVGAGSWASFSASALAAAAASAAAAAAKAAATWSEAVELDWVLDRPPVNESSFVEEDPLRGRGGLREACDASDSVLPLRLEGSRSGAEGSGDGVARPAFRRDLPVYSDVEC